MFAFEGKTAFITGGASGIGLGIARALAKRGCNIVLADIDTEQLSLAKGAFGRDIMTIQMDVRDRDRWAAAKDEVEEELGHVSILINNAGVMDNPGVPMSKRGLVDYSPERWDRMIDISLTGIANGVMTFGPDIRDRGFGHIVNTASTQGLIPTRGVAAYSASKFGVVALTEALRDELAENDIGVSVLIPGVVSTRLAENELKKMGVNIPGFKMPGMDPEEVGEMVVSAIKNNQLYIITHGEYAKYCEDRFLRIRAAFTEVPVSADFDPDKPLAGTREWARHAATEEAKKEVQVDGGT